jgi:hypothetical protein
MIPARKPAPAITSIQRLETSVMTWMAVSPGARRGRQARDLRSARPAGEGSPGRAASGASPGGQPGEASPGRPARGGQPGEGSPEGQPGIGLIPSGGALPGTSPLPSLRHRPYQIIRCGCPIHAAPATWLGHSRRINGRARVASEGSCGHRNTGERRSTGDRAGREMHSGAGALVAGHSGHAESLMIAEPLALLSREGRRACRPPRRTSQRSRRGSRSAAWWRVRVCRRARAARGWRSRWPRSSVGSRG